VAIARVAEPSGSLQEVKEWGLDREDLLQIYRNMVTTRGVEERGHILYRQGKIPGSFYTGRGNEGAAVGVATAMGPDDVGTPLHRDMGVHITRGVEPWRIFAQYMGRQDGPTHGRDGNVHMADQQPGLIAKVWLASPETNTYGGMYTWRDRQSMEAYMQSDLVKSFALDPNVVGLTSRDYAVLEEPTRVTAGILAVPA